MKHPLAALLVLLLATSSLALGFDPPEEVLQGSVRLTWQDLEDAVKVQIWRRPAGGPSTRLGFVSAALDPVFTDRGPSGEGLTPGDWEYQIRGRYPDGAGGLVSGPLLSQLFTLHAECEPQPAPSSALPVVVIGDLDADTRYTGADVGLALDACQALGGCILEALPLTYDDVEIQLGTHQANACAATSLCRDWQLPAGLVIQGHGSATVFRSRVFGPGNYRPRPVFRVALTKQDAPLDGIRFRNFTVDGRKREQPDPGTPSWSWGHNGIDVLSPSAAPEAGCVHNITARELLKNGLALQGAVDWILERNTVEHIGCHVERTSCDSLTSATPPATPGRPDTQALGFGVNVLQFTSGTVVRHNRIAFATKMGIQFKTFTRAWPIPPTAAQQATMVQDFHAHDNHISDGMGSGIAVNGGVSGLVEQNIVEFTTAPNETSIQTAAGFVCGNWVRDLTVLNNIFRHNGQEGMALGCVGEMLSIRGNLLQDNCRDIGTGQTSLKIGSVLPSLNAWLVDNVVEADACNYSLVVGPGWEPTIIAGGSYEAGASALAGIRVNGGRHAIFAAFSLSNQGSQQIPGLQFMGGVEGATVMDGPFYGVTLEGFDPDIEDRSGNVVVCAQIEDPVERVALGCGP